MSSDITLVDSVILFYITYPFTHVGNFLVYIIIITFFLQYKDGQLHNPYSFCTPSPYYIPIYISSL